MKGAVTNDPDKFSEFFYTEKDVRLSKLVFDGKSVTFGERPRIFQNQVLPLEFIISNLAITPVMHEEVDKIRREISRYPVYMVSGELHNGRMKGVIRTLMFGDYLFPQLHFGIEINGTQYVGHSFSYNEKKGVLEAVARKPKEPVDLSQIKPDFTPAVRDAFNRRVYFKR